MKQWWLAAFMLLSSCSQPGSSQEVEFDMTVRSVEWPPSVSPGSDLTLPVEVEVGGCTGFKRLEAVERTASQLRLRAVGTRKEGWGVVCTANLGWQKVTYTDPGTPERTDPFEVIVNGKSWGKVAVGSFRTEKTNFNEVLFPRGTTPTAPLSITGRLVSHCLATPPKWRVISRTEHQLQLEASEQITVAPNLSCPPVYQLEHVVYVDQSGTPRLDPFEIVVNGKSWGSVKVGPTVAADPSESLAQLIQSYLPTSVGAAQPLYLNLGYAEKMSACTKYRFEVARTSRSLDLKVIRRASDVCEYPDSIGNVYYVDPPEPTRANPFTLTSNGQTWGTIEIR